MERIEAATAMTAFGDLACGVGRTGHGDNCADYGAALGAQFELGRRGVNGACMIFPALSLNCGHNPDRKCDTVVHCSGPDLRDSDRPILR